MTLAAYIPAIDRGIPSECIDLGSFVRPDEYMKKGHCILCFSVKNSKNFLAALELL
jgi:hypothetical protein